MNLANQLSVLRVMLAPLFVTVLLYATPERPHLLGAAAVIFLFACATDALDGYLARFFNEQSLFGSYLDPIADKLLLTCGFLSLSLIGHLPPAMHIPAWVSVPVIARDALILIGAGIIYITTGKLKAEPLKTSKATTFVQMLTLMAALLSFPEEIRRVLFGATVAMTLISGALYVRVAGRLLP